MINLILIGVVCSTIITSIVNCAKPAYKKFAGKYTITISTLLSFVLGVICAFSIVSYMGLELPAGLVVLTGLALGTGSSIFYDVLELIKAWSEKIKMGIKK